MNSKLIGGILLIVGTSIGAGMLALPLVTAQIGIERSLLLFFMAWFLMTTAAVYILKVNLTLPHGSNMISMARHTIGKPGQIVTWVSYLMLLYSLLAAYLSGGADLFTNLCQLFHYHISHWGAVLVFLAIFGGIVYKGVKIVDMTNRGLMTIKMGSFALLIILLVSHVHMTNFVPGSTAHIPSAILVIITSFGYSAIIPSLRDYFGEQDHLLLKAVLIGSVIPLVCYILWIFVVLGVVPTTYHLNDLSHLVGNLSVLSHSNWISNCVHLFSYICITTSFLGVSLALTDFVADGFKLKREGASRLGILAITYGPPVLVVLFYPSLFVKGLALAGVFCIILLMLLPALMVFKMAKSHRWLVWLETLASVGLLVFALTRL